MVTPESVKSGIEGGLACEHVEVIGDGQHFQAVVVSAQFAGKSRVQRHQLVYAALGDRMREEIHALSMQTLTPEEWNKKRQNWRVERRHGQAENHRRPAARGRSAGLRRQERRAADHVRRAALGEAARAHQRAAAARRVDHGQAAGANGRGGRARRTRRGTAREGDHRPDRDLRAGEDHARLGAGAGAAARALRRGQGVAARRLRHRRAPGRPARQGPAGDGRDDLDRARLHAGEREPPARARASSWTSSP